MEKRDGLAAEILLEQGKISLTGMKISPYICKHLQGMKVQRCCRERFLTTAKTKFSRQAG
jgi:hypothetical protein